jgi:Glyoxalase-like domain
MGSRVGNITFDCDDVLKVAGFWSAVLSRPIDDGSSEEFASIGGADAERSEPAWYFNKVPELKRAKNRVHLDLLNPDSAVVTELLALGARVVDQHDWGFHGWTVLEDPEGNEFCLAAKSFEQAKAARRR